MLMYSQPNRTPPPRRRIQRRAWLWSALIGVGFLGVLLSAWLIIAQSGFSFDNESAQPGAAAQTATAATLPPGTRWYYERSQWQPLDQQP